MFTHAKVASCVVVLVFCQVCQAQDPLSGGAEYTLRTYEVGDLVVDIQDYPYSGALQRAPAPAPGGYGGGGMGGGGGGFFSMPDEDGRVGNLPSQAINRFQLAQFGGGGGEFGGRGRRGGEMGVGGPGGPEFNSGNDGPNGGNASVTVSDILRVLTTTVDRDSWGINGGNGQVERLGTALVVWQVPQVHKQIEALLVQLREGSAKRKTVTIDARWLMLDSDDLENLVLPDSKGVPEVDRKHLARLTRRPGSIRGITNCLSSQLVYVVSGTNKSFVVGYIPVVGSVEAPDQGVQLAGGGAGPRIQLVTDRQSPANPRDVGYQPIQKTVNLGAVLEIRPTLIPLVREAMAVVDLKSTVTAAGDPRHEMENMAPDGLAPAVDRVAIETQEFATTLRLPLGKPVLVGGMTSIASSSERQTVPEPTAADGGANEERAQLYLVLEVR